ncbi:helix-turn-helix transcriptional regulator [Corynebacterium kalidii]
MSMWWKWLEEHRRPGMSDRAFADFIDLDPATVSRWRSGRVPGASEIVRVARVLGASPVDALVAGGVLAEKEAAELRQGFRSLADIPLGALMYELQRRLDDLSALESRRSTSGLNPDSVAKGLYQ